MHVYVYVGGSVVPCVRIWGCVRMSVEASMDMHLNIFFWNNMQKWLNVLDCVCTRVCVYAREQKCDCVCVREFVIVIFETLWYINVVYNRRARVWVKVCACVFMCLWERELLHYVKVGVNVKVSNLTLNSKIENWSFYLKYLSYVQSFRGGGTLNSQLPQRYNSCLWHLELWRLSVPPISSGWCFLTQLSG